MHVLQAVFAKLKDWLASNSRRRYTVAAVITLAALASVLPSINSYTIMSRQPPTGPFAWLATSAIGAHEVDPQYSQACITHDHYYPVGMPVDQSGWPSSFEYDIFTARYDCAGMFYPVPFVIDLGLFAALYAIVLLTVPLIFIKLRHNKYITRKRIIFIIAASTLSVCLTYETAHFVRITGPSPQAPPVLSGVIASDYDIPVSFPLCPSDNAMVNNKICHAYGGCALTGISEPSDPRDATQGWPIAYIYTSLDPCFGDAIYPLIFLADSVLYMTIVSAVAILIGHIRLQKIIRARERI